MLPDEIGSNVPLPVNSGAEHLMSLPLREAREIFEREYLLSQINRFGGNISRTAEAEVGVATQISTAGGGVEVVFDRSGKTLSWIPDAGSLLDLAESNGIQLDFGCRAGNCGTCVTAIKEGEVSYMSEPGAEPEDGSCLACIAVPKGRLVVDG